MMTPPIALIIAIVLISTNLHSLIADDAHALTINSLKTALSSDLLKAQEPRKTLDQQYREQLNGLRGKYRNSGGVRAVLAVEDELADLSGDFENKDRKFPELNRLQRIYLGATPKADDEVAQLTIKVMDAYKKKFEELSIRLTKGDLINEAKESLDYAETLHDRIEETKARLSVMVPEKPAAETGERQGSFEKTDDEMRNALGMMLRWIPPGKFTMGSPEEEPGREAQNEKQADVEITKGFWIGKFEVTQEEYERLMGENPSRFLQFGNKAPVESVTWAEAWLFCQTLTIYEEKRKKLPEGWVYTLPTEAQWEYACRAGTTGPFNGDNIDDLGWYKSNSGGHSHKVGQKEPNQWGLYDMHGNVRELCLDKFAYTIEGGKDPTGPTIESGTRLARGGHYEYPDSSCRSARRSASPTINSYPNLGMRVVLVQKVE